MYEFLPDNPYRAVDWRWERARTIREGGPKFSKHRDDKWIHRAWKFQQRLFNCHSDYQRCKLARDMPDMWWAYQFHDQEDRPGKWAMEARLLVREELYGSIAHKLRTSVDAVDAYENVFFSVRAELEHLDYIVQTVIGPSVYRGLNERDYDLLWKLYGYGAGGVVLDELISTFNNPIRPRTPDEGDNFKHDEVVSNLRRKAMIAARVLPVNSFTGMEFIDKYMTWLNIERGSDNAGDVQNTIVSNVQAMLVSLPFQMAGTGRKDMDMQEIKQYDYGSAELRADELILAGIGGEIPNSELLKNLRFPEPPNHEETQQGSGS